MMMDDDTTMPAGGDDGGMGGDTGGDMGGDEAAPTPSAPSEGGDMGGGDDSTPA